MADAAVTAARGSPSAGELVAWTLAPVAALALLWIVLFATPGSHCEFDVSVPTYAVVLIYVVAAVGSLGCLAAAARCITALRNAPSGFPWHQLNFAVAVVLALVVIDALLPLSASHAELYWRLCVVCIPATTVLLLVLLLAALLRRTREDVGLLLPAYLIGAAVFVYPSVAVVAISLKNGALC